MIKSNLLAPVYAVLKIHSTSGDCEVYYDYNVARKHEQRTSALHDRLTLKLSGPTKSDHLIIRRPFHNDKTASTRDILYYIV